MTTQSYVDIIRDRVDVFYYESLFLILIQIFLMAGVTPGSSSMLSLPGGLLIQGSTNLSMPHGASAKDLQRKVEFKCLELEEMLEKQG